MYLTVSTLFAAHLIEMADRLDTIHGIFPLGTLLELLSVEERPSFTAETLERICDCNGLQLCASEWESVQECHSIAYGELQEALDVWSV